MRVTRLIAFAVVVIVSGAFVLAGVQRMPGWAVGLMVASIAVIAYTYGWHAGANERE